MKISNPTYLIAELVGDVIPLVQEMRQRFNPDNIHWPADITIAGSSGVGTLKEGQCLDDVIEELTPVIREHTFTDINFIDVCQFANTGIYYLKPQRDHFDTMHRAVISSCVEFNEITWPYNPHCTLCWHDEDSLEYKTLFEKVSLPKNSTIECFSLYQPMRMGGLRIHTFENT